MLVASIDDSRFAMGRALRLKFAGPVDHITGRGTARDPIERGGDASNKT